MSGVISGSNRIFGVIGDPVSHSLSPLMFNAAFSELGMDCAYMPFRVEKERLGDAIKGMVALNISGLNVTIPHKVEVMALLDRVDETAADIGAVNTIVNEDGKLIGYNTDAPGFLDMLSLHSIEVKGKKAVVLGAGGAAMAIAYALAGQGADMVILNRTLSRAENIAVRIQNKFKKQVRALELNPENMEKSLESASILINTTSIGMKPDTGSTPVNPELLKPGMSVVDIVYNPLKTRLLEEAGIAGCHTVKGIHMLVAQGALAFEKWTGRKAPVEIMTHIAISELKKI